jgi:alanine-glyoxylate transaminase/serine-glyoxylate transaminase/serine-pyruvate transaminase
MTVASGREFLSIPGPTNIPDAVVAAMQRPAIDIYSGEMLGLTHSLHEDLPKVFRTTGRTYIYAANGHGGWEAALSNVLSRGETVLVLESGLFAVGWGEMAQMMGVKVEVLKGDPRRAVSPAAVTQRLEADTSHEIKAILVVQIDTASGVANDIAAIRKAIDAARHPALLLVDAVASLGCMPFEMDAWGIDVAMSGSQKGLMTPPGLAFVAAGERAHAAHQKADLRTRYWDWTFRQGEAHYQKYGGTPPQHLLFGLRKALDMLSPKARIRGATARALLAGGAAGGRRWAEGGARHQRLRAAERANSITCVLMPDRNPQPLLDYCRHRCGVVLGVGIGGFNGRAFRIAHMGHINAPMLFGTLGAVEMGLGALGVPHGAGGVQRAVEYLGREVRP